MRGDKVECDYERKRDEIEQGNQYSADCFGGYYGATEHPKGHQGGDNFAPGLKDESCGLGC
jgi:hypothetical protein